MPVICRGITTKKRPQEFKFSLGDFVLGTEFSSRGFFHPSTKSNLFSFISCPSTSLGSPHYPPVPASADVGQLPRRGDKPPASQGIPAAQAPQDQGVATPARRMTGPNSGCYG